MNKKTITKNLKPIDQDIHFKYVCPNNKCGYHHWLSLLETQTKAFKVVCSCGCIFSPKRISKTKILYKKRIVSKPPVVSKEKYVNNKPVDFENKCGKLLESYGFSKTEIKALISNAQTNNNFETPSALLKHILSNLNLPNFGE
jgi:hypothetical protein